jgi:hypothetical protein
MTDWIEHTTDTCPVDPETVVAVRHTKHHRVSSGKALYMAWGRYPDRLPGGGFGTPVPDITHYRIITPAPTPPLFLGGDPVKPAWLDDPDPGADPAKPLKPTGVLRREIYEDPADWKRASYAENAKPPEPEMTNPPNYLDTLSEEQRRRILLSCPTKPEPDFIALRLECLKLALQESSGTDYQRTADIFLHYVLNGSVDKA